ncbi:AI-2E family transporter [Rubrivirga sp. S365]|uniref:AI-2E family transporter n=1 Tax=Rubrivirga litoralis TaxID=3075598 RepID=A0ABU3BNE9_9BACT|nr:MULTISPECIES: AI-2E family transporter [unclassified Rubrivirga]MDT0630821.1 AI-2E family transporter [Rubrivirga sp. F394]MDT7857373.1 AI-2E family transporter [Rubrivirga sp. S365]
MTLGRFVQRVLIGFVAVVVVVGLWTARDTLLYGFAAAVLAVGISIPAGWLRRVGLPRGWAIAISALGMGVVAVALLLLVLPRLLSGLGDLVGGLPAAIGGLSDVYADLRTQGEFWYEALPPLDGTAELSTERAQALLRRVVEGSLAVAPVVLGGVSTLVAALVHLGIVIFVSLFFITDPRTYVRGSLYLFPERAHARVVFLWNELYSTVRTWITALSLSIAITTTLVWVVLGLILGMPGALVVAVFAGIATFIPNIGSILPVVPIVVFALASGDPSRVFLYVAAYLAIQLLESNVLTPSIVKSQLAIPAGVVLLFQLVVTLAFGALGLLLAVPLLACLIVLVRELYSYDLLGLRTLQIELSKTDDGRLVLHETDALPDDPPPVEARPAAAVPEAAS